MKNLFKILTIGMLLFSLQATAQNPTIVRDSKTGIEIVVNMEHSETEIEEMINRFERMAKFDAQPREAVLAQFRRDFRRASDVNWVTAAGIFRAEFTMKKQNHKAYYDTSGNLLRHIVE